ncbi:MAG TPA: hypothetical protein VN181_17210, partial [Thermoanaerobaculia bacterium]|nr:hypothetical protein [Thermoanaerobaculia bacterium]
MLTRTAALLPLPIGYLAAAGAAWLASKVRRRAVIVAIALLASLDLAVFAKRFQPYLDRADAAIGSTPVIDFLRADKPPFRVVPFFNYLWPNTAQMFGIEDTRSQFMSELAYRRLLLRIDRGAWSGKGTILGFNSLDFHFDDPVVGMLGVRWFLEHRSIDIVRWKTHEATVPVTPGAHTIPLDVASSVRIEVPVDAEPFWAIDVPVDVASTEGAAPRLVATLEKNGAVAWSRAFTPDDLRAIGRMYVPLRPYARLGEHVTLVVRSRGIRGSLEGHYSRVKTPVVFERELPDGRLFRNLAEVPRFHAVTRLRKLNDDEFLAARDIDLASEAVITDDPVMLPDVDGRDARVTLTKYEPAEQRIATRSTAPFFLASSEKVSPELRVLIDGNGARIIEINTMFAGVVVPAGRHEVRFERRIGRGWWWVAAIGAALWLAIAIAEVTASMRRR